MISDQNITILFFFIAVICLKTEILAAVKKVPETPNSAIFKMAAARESHG